MKKVIEKNFHKSTFFKLIIHKKYFYNFYCLKSNDYSILNSFNINTITGPFSYSTMNEKAFNFISIFFFFLASPYTMPVEAVDSGDLRERKKTSDCVCNNPFSSSPLKVILKGMMIIVFVEHTILLFSLWFRRNLKEEKTRTRIFLHPLKKHQNLF